MTGFLASVENAHEAAIALAEGVDLIDLKRPAAGALGALTTAEAAAIVRALSGRRPVSATVGDLPPEAPALSRAVAAMAATGVDFVKIGLFPGGDPRRAVAALAPLARTQVALVAVLFADQALDMDLLNRIADAGFRGAMLDTAAKRGVSLRHWLSRAELAEFVRRCRQQRLLCGLAGSLRLDDIPDLLELEPDYLGFRGALCTDGVRTGALSRAAVRSVRTALRPAAASRSLA